MRHHIILAINHIIDVNNEILSLKKHTTVVITQEIKAYLYNFMLLVITHVIIIENEINIIIICKTFTSD
jgi:hypothetical protein